MTSQYWMGDFFIDLSRNQITRRQQSQTLAPKALAVLTCLAENQGKVVSHETLLSEVWSGSIVSPNSLQRSIAQLRKALGDDGKVQVYIKTHAKQGYSLECDVRWLHENDPTAPGSIDENPIGYALAGEAISDTGMADRPHSSKTGLWLGSIAVGIILLGIVGYQYLSPEQAPQLTFDTLRSITATDDKEFDASYTPDGQYIVFHRYLDKLCANQLWAKNINTQQEILLTKDWGAYGRHSFSSDGKRLVFLATEPCGESITQLNCYNLVSLDFEKALASPQQPSVILQCQNSQVQQPVWLSDDNIALLQKHSERWKLISYSISGNRSTDIYELQDGNLIHFAYSASDDLIAVTSIHENGRHYIEMLKPDGRMVSSHPIEYPQEIPESRLLYPNFDPLNEQLVFSTGRQLFTLSYDGKVSKISSPFSDTMQQPEFHPDGKRLLMIKGPYDSDIVSLPLSQIAETATAGPWPSFERSTVGEDFAIFQPDGDLIAFQSERSGEQQLWISTGNGPQQLTRFPVDTSIAGFDWSADGNSLLVNANNVLTQVFLDSTQKAFPLAYPVSRLYQWDSQSNTALLLLRIQGVAKLVEYDLGNSEIIEVSDKRVLWALKSEDGRLIYKDTLDQFWQPGPVEPRHIEPLNGQAGRAKSFVINGNAIYAINAENQLWTYDLTNDTFTILGEVTADVDYLSDINQTQLLMTIQVAAKKEVVELSFSE